MTNNTRDPGPDAITRFKFNNATHQRRYDEVRKAQVTGCLSNLIGVYITDIYEAAL